MPADGDGGFVVGLEGRKEVGETTILVGDVVGGRKAAGEAESFGEVEVKVMVETVILGALFWTGLSGGTVTEEVTTVSGGVGMVFTTATVGETASAVETDTYMTDEIQTHTELYY